jgi:2-polyprenyl-3-methyl-5-hydroxy-6-metoxy-1,4-benzoquinol methylase
LIAEKLGFKAYGMEASEEAVKIAKEKFGLNVVQALSFDELPEEFRGPYKIITALEILQRVEAPVKFLKTAFELLEEGGYLLLSVPSYFKFEHQSFGYKKYKWWYGNYPPNHLTRWKPWTLFYALKKAGFSEVLIFTEPTLSGTILEGAQIKEVELREKGKIKAILPKNFSTAVIIDAFKWLPLNARTLGNFQCAIAIKGKTNYNWEEITKRAIYYSAVETMWGKEDKI